MAEDLRNELLSIGLEDDIRREMLSFLTKPSEFFPRREGVGLVFSFWRGRHPDLLARITDEQLRAIWQRAMRDEFNPPTCPIKDSDLLYGPLIPCEGIDILLRQNPVISRGLFRFAYGETPFAQRGGIEFSSNGWQPILEEAFGWLEAEAVARKDAGFPNSHLPVLAQVKEKFGSLTIYADVPAVLWPEWRERMQAAEERSSKTCMRCGAPGELRRNGWAHVYCDACEDAYRAEKGAL